MIVEHPNGEKPYVTVLTLKGEQHVVESERGEGGGTYRVCFKNTQPKGSSARVEVRENEPNGYHKSGPDPRVTRTGSEPTLFVRSGTEPTRNETK